jgi:hypothetical protein
MGYKNGYEYTPPDCPICDKERGAIMGSTRWKPFDGSVCSEKCGLEAKARLDRWMQSEQYKSITKKLRSAQHDLIVGERAALSTPPNSEE